MVYAKTADKLQLKISYHLVTLHTLPINNSGYDRRQNGNLGIDCNLHRKLIEVNDAIHIMMIKAMTKKMFGMDN